MKKLLCGLLLTTTLLTGCGNKNCEIADEAIALAGAPPNTVEIAVASGIYVESNSRVKIDYSNTKDGYVMIQLLSKSEKKIKVQVCGPTTTYTYNLATLEWTTFPLSDGNGNYSIKVFEQVVDSKYSLLLSASFQATMTDEFAPFLRSNQYVDYANSANTVNQATELCSSLSSTLDKVAVVYDWVVTNVSYDKELAKTVQSGYLPVLDNILTTKKGICFDYAALMTGMLRSQGVPCKLVVGYAGTAYHAWISVWTEENGWIDGAIYFDGNQWQRMDPTFASSGSQSDSIMAYIGDGSNYTSKYFY